MPRPTHLYVWVAARFYFLVSFVDAYSRYVVHHKLLISLDGQSVAIELQAALESVESAKPRIVHDHGSDAAVRAFGQLRSLYPFDCGTSVTKWSAVHGLNN